MTTGIEGRVAATAATGVDDAGSAALAASAAAAVRRWKIVALVSTFVAVAMVAGVTGWALRGEPDSASGPTAFTGGGVVVANVCVPEIGGLTIDNAQVIVLDAAGKQLASSRLMPGVADIHGDCRRAFVIDGIPGGSGIYTLQVGRWKQPFTEVALRSNLAELRIG